MWRSGWGGPVRRLLVVRADAEVKNGVPISVLRSCLAMTDFAFCSLFISHRDALPVCLHVLFFHLCFYLCGFRTNTCLFTCFYFARFLFTARRFVFTSKRLFVSLLELALVTLLLTYFPTCFVTPHILILVNRFVTSFSLLFSPLRSPLNHIFVRDRLHPGSLIH